MSLKGRVYAKRERERERERERKLARGECYEMEFLFFNGGLKLYSN